MIMQALRWAGITWDEGPDIGGPHAPYRQSERGAIYKEHAEILVQKGAAYRCFCTSERLEQLRKSQLARKVNPGYDGHCRELPASEIDAKLKEGTPFVVRLKIPKEGNTVVNDKLRGEVSIENHQIDDQVLLKSDGMPTYHLANVVDDRLMGITHVIRAEEWITSSPKHVLLYRAFGWPAPEFIHMPLLRNQDKSKISKRKNPVSINYYREAGFIPEALLNYLGMMGWTHPSGAEKFTVKEMIEAFDWGRISLGGPVFDIKKLTWLNGLYLREMKADELAQRLRDTVFSEAALKAIAPLVHERIEKLEDFIDATSYFFAGDVHHDDATIQAMIPKGKTAKDTAGVFEAVLEVIDAQPGLTAQPLEAALRELADKLQWKAKDLFMPLRLAVSGRSATPPLFDTMAVLGKERTRRRMRAALAKLRELGG
jgi:glutamyl-tRNA synthetase